MKNKILILFALMFVSVSATCWGCIPDYGAPISCADGYAVKGMDTSLKGNPWECVELNSTSIVCEDCNSTFDTRYLMLNASNDPLTSDLSVQGNITSTGQVCDSTGCIGSANATNCSACESIFVDVVGDTMTGDLFFSSTNDDVILKSVLGMAGGNSGKIRFYDGTNDAGSIYYYKTMMMGAGGLTLTGDRIVLSTTGGSGDIVPKGKMWFPNNAGPQFGQAGSFGPYYKIYYRSSDKTLQHESKTSFGVIPTSFVFNEGSINTDFRIEGNNNINTFFLDAGLDRIGIKTNAPSTTLDVNGDVTADSYFGDGSHLTGITIVDTNATTECSGDWVALDGEGSCIDVNASTSIDLDCTDCLGDIQMQDIYLHNNGDDTTTGVLTANGFNDGTIAIGSGDIQNAQNVSAYEFWTDNIHVYENFIFSVDKNITFVPVPGRVSFISDVVIYNNGLLSVDTVKATSSFSPIEIQDSVDVDGYGTFDGDLNATENSNIGQNLTIGGDLIVNGTSYYSNAGSIIMDSGQLYDDNYNGTRLSWIHNTTKQEKGNIRYEWYQVINAPTGLYLESDANIFINAGYDLNMSAGNSILLPNKLLRIDDQYVTWGTGRFGSNDMYMHFNGTKKTMHFRPFLWMDGGKFMWNRDGYDIDWDYRGDNDDNLFKIDAGGDRVCIGSNCTGSNAKLNVTGNVTAVGYLSSDGSQGITNTTGFWMCTDATCTGTCQVQIKDGLVVGCV